MSSVPTLFNIFLEFVMKELKCIDTTLQLNDSLFIDIRYVDDTPLLSVVFDRGARKSMQETGDEDQWR